MNEASTARQDGCRLFFLFAPVFKDWPFLIAEEVKKLAGDVKVSGLVTGMPNTSRHVMRRAEEAGFGPIDHLGALERQWLSSPVPAERLEDYEKMLGSAAIQKLIISDRHLGAGFVSGARLPRTPLATLAGDKEMRTRYLVGMLDYLKTHLERERPDLVFCYAIAGAPAYAIAMLSEHLGIPFLRLTHSRVGARHVLDRSILGLMSNVEATYRAAATDPAVLANEMEPARQLVRDFRERSEAPQYVDFFRKLQKKNLSTAQLLREFVSLARATLLPKTKAKEPSLRHPTHWERAKHRTLLWYEARRLLRSGLFADPDSLPRSDYIYFPLHFDPEASTMVFAPFHTDQLAVIEALTKAAPASLRVVVKEHIPMIGLRPPGFYERLTRLPGVVLASPALDSFDLIKRSSVTVAITGTAAWEALLLGRPAVTIGAAPFNVVNPGIEHCPELTRLPEAISAALARSEAADRETERFIAAILKESFDLPYELLWANVEESRLPEQQRIAGLIAQHICRVTGVSTPLPAAAEARSAASAS
ncbi:MAG TPA: hypothetical protein EYP07_03350 [Kiloniellaceae bacterium]|nr:hypothetical protein [Kiloniellaceae bacterium]